jgi:hypothetical protein
MMPTYKNFIGADVLLLLLLLPASNIGRNLWRSQQSVARFVKSRKVKSTTCRNEFEMSGHFELTLLAY